MDEEAEHGQAPGRPASPRVVFFLSSGRCGTQRIASMLGSCYADRVVARHEPIEMAYAPRHFLRREDLEPQLAASDRIREHFAAIDAILAAGGRYVETGWPALAWLPYLAHRHRRAGFRIVHLVRHPVPTALSLATHGFHAGRGSRSRLAELHPEDPGTRHGAEYLAPWHGLSRFEKCLFQWLEIHRYALELEEELSGVPWLRLRFEDLFAAGEPSRAAIDRLLGFLDLPVRSDALDRMQVSYDRFRATSPELGRWQIGRASAPLGALCERLGYDFEAVDPGALRQRYGEAKTGERQGRRLFSPIRALARGLRRRF